MKKVYGSSHGAKMKAFGVSQHIDRGLLKGCLFFIRVVRVGFTAVLLDRYKHVYHCLRKPTASGLWKCLGLLRRCKVVYIIFPLLYLQDLRKLCVILEVYKDHSSFVIRR